MEFLHGAMVVATLGGALIVIAVSVVIFYFLFQAIWPSLIGAAAVYGLWEYVDQFMAVVSALVFLVFQLWWLAQIKEKDPLEGQVLEDNRKKQQMHDIYLPRYLD